MLNYKNRQNRVFVLTMDRILADDVRERIRYDPRMTDVEVITPGEGIGAIADSDVAALAKDTITGRLNIFDTRSQTLPRLQEPYNRVVGFNRGDVNERCFSICIGDGPSRLLEPGSSIDAFAGLLAKIRIDYSAAAFFYDPLLHYAPDERPMMGIGHDNSLPRALPRRLAKAFAEDNLDVPRVRRYFRAADVDPTKKEAVKVKRQAKYAKLIRKLIQKAFPHQAAELGGLISTEGHAVGDEIQRLHTYPCFFEDWVFDLLGRAERE